MFGCASRVILVCLLWGGGIFLYLLSKDYDNSSMNAIGLIMMGVGFFLMLMFRHEGKTGKKIFETMEKPKLPFTTEYFNLLQQNARELGFLLKRISNDSVIFEQLKKNEEIKNQEDCEDIIKRCAYYDLYQIIQTLQNKYRLDNLSLEASGWFIVKSIINSPYFYAGYTYLQWNERYQNGKLKKEIDLEGVPNKPMRISVSESLDDKEIASYNSFTSRFSLPAFLHAMDSPCLKEYATILYRFATIISKTDNVVTNKGNSELKIIHEALHNPFPEKEYEHLPTSNNEPKITYESLNDVLYELNSLIGLQVVKEEINTLINFIKVQKDRERSGLKTSPISYHIVFTGNPGTGKTTVARIVAKLYKHLGILSEGHLVETDRSGLVAEYLGQTAPKVNRTVNSALNGILFIDEAYSLVGEDKDDFGKEAVATLIKRMEDDRDKLVVVLAGYTGEMKRFIDTNPGFESRFNRYIEFPDYTPNELLAIFESKCRQLEYKLTPEALIKAQLKFEQVYQQRTKSFGNARLVRNLFEKTIEQQANRIAKLTNVTKEKLVTIEAEDFV
jgi:AAA+ superfamily predicted ATPase